MSFLSTKLVTEALSERLKAVRYPDDQLDDAGAASALAGEPCFEIVTLSDAPDLGTVLTRLVAVSERIAAVVPGLESFKEDATTGRLVKKQRFTLMFSTQDFDPFEDPSFFGEEGLLRIAELVVDALLKPFGENRSALRHARIRPLRGGSQLVVVGEGETREVAGGESAREVYFLEVEAKMGSGVTC